MSTTPDPHAILISLLTTLYSLLVDQQYTPAHTVIPPPHHADSIDITAAKEANFADPDLLALLLRLPYLITDIEIPLAYETLPLVYINSAGDLNASGDAFDFARDPAHQDRTDLIPPGMLVLTRANNGGETLLYELNTRRIRVWNHFLDERDDWQGTRAWDIEDEGNPLVGWIRKWIGLERVLMPSGGGGWRFVQFEGPLVAAETSEREKGMRAAFTECRWDSGAWGKVGREGGGVAQMAERARRRAVLDFNAEDLVQRRGDFAEAGEM